METNYDVLRWVVNHLRHTASDSEIAAVHAVIDKNDPAVTTPAEEAKADA